MNAAFALDPGSPPLFANLGDNIARPHSRNEFGDVAGTFAQRRSRYRLPHRRAPAPERAHGGTRLRRELRRRPGCHDGLRGHAKRAHHQDRCRHAPRYRAGQGARPGRRYRRVVRPEDRRVTRRARRGRRLACCRPAGQVGRGPRREPHRVGAGARGELRRPGRGQQRRRPARAGREDGHRHRLIPGHGHDGPGHHAGDAARSVQARGAGFRVHRGDHEQGIVRRLPRAVGVRDVRAGTRPGPHRERSRPRSGRDPAA